MFEFIRSVLFRKSRATYRAVVATQANVDVVAARTDSLLADVKSAAAKTDALLTEFVAASAKVEVLLTELRALKEQGEFRDQNVHRIFEQNRSPDRISEFSPRLRRNFLPNDDAAIQKQLMLQWRNEAGTTTTSEDLLDSAFRVFSQNDEDGIILRIFSIIKATNRCVMEIGSNCSDSDIGIPENLSTNLIVNHGWHGAIFEIDPVECARMRYFFSRDFATKHFHMTDGDRQFYYSPQIVAGAVTPDNVNSLLMEAVPVRDPDLLIIDIDGGDYAVMEELSGIHPRVLVVEFEKRFRDRFDVVQPDRNNFGKRFPQSGAASLGAWNKLLCQRNYTLCAIGTCGYNAFFVRSDLAATAGLQSLEVKEAFDSHPILSHAPEALWLLPDESWQTV